MTATIEETDLTNKLLTVPQFLNVLEKTENMSSLSVPMDGTMGTAMFGLPPGWNVGLSDKDPQEITDAHVSWGGTEYKMTKEAILGSAHAFGISPGYVTKTPGVLIASHLNYWSGHSPDVTLKYLTKGDTLLAVTKESIKPFSNIQLLEQVVDAIYSTYGMEEEEDLLVDFKSFHDLHQTNIRLVVAPEQHAWVMDKSGQTWSPGIQLCNSLTGKTALSVSSYLFSWDITSGVVMPNVQGRYNRKFNGQEMDDVLAWTKAATDTALETMSHEAEILENLGLEDIHDAVSKVLADVFKSYSIPMKVRGDVMDHLIQSEDNTYYGIVNAVAKTANLPGLSPLFVSNVLEAAGEIAAHAHERCNSCKRAYL